MRCEVGSYDDAQNVIGVINQFQQHEVAVHQMIKRAWKSLVFGVISAADFVGKNVARLFVPLLESIGQGPTNANIEKHITLKE